MKEKIVLLKIINKIKTEKEQKSIQILFDIMGCKLKYGANLKDYNAFEMYKMSDFERSTVITKKKNNEYIKKYNNPKYMKYINNALEFHTTFNKFLNRDWLNLTENIKEFKKFCNNYEQIIAYASKKKELINTKSKSLEKLYKELTEKKVSFIEEQVETSSTLQKIAPDAKISIKIITLLGRITAAYLEFENEKKIFIPIDIETGESIKVGIDKENNMYEKYPETNKNIIGIKIPNWERIKEVCNLACLEVPEVSYVEWRVTVEDKKCFLLSASATPNHYLYQRPAHRENNIGFVPLFKKIEEGKIEE